MSAESAASSQQCACSNISLMQLFHELKQKFPQVPDYVVNDTIAKFCHNKSECEKRLESEAKASLIHAYHAKSSLIAKQRQKGDTPIECINEICPNIKEPLISATEPSYAREKLKLSIPCNPTSESNCEVLAPDETLAENAITINLDNCEAKLSHSDVESGDDKQLTNDGEKIELNPFKPFKIKKSGKIKTGLDQKLQAKAIKADKKESKTKETGQITKFEKKVECPKTPELWLDNIQPLNVSVNVNYHMDLSPMSSRPSQLSCTTELIPDDFAVNPRAVTSVNFTVCTPSSSNMPSPIGTVGNLQNPNDEFIRGFQGQVTVTVNPSNARTPPMRRAPPPPSSRPAPSPPPSRPAPPPPVQVLQPNTLSTRALTPRKSPEPETSLIQKQRKRLEALENAMNSEKERLQKLTREMQILKSPLPTKEATQKLKDYVTLLREHCMQMSKQAEGDQASAMERDSQTPELNQSENSDDTPSWQCHVCTFRNHGLLNKCEECDMPRIMVTATVGDGDLRRLSGQVETNLVFNPTQESAPEWQCV